MPMSSDPLSREVSMPSTSSSESTLEVTSSPAGRRVTEPVHDMETTSSRLREEEEDEVTVNCEDL